MDINDLKKLAGINEFKGYTEYTPENISKTAAEKRKIEKERGIKPGDPDWFKLWFSLPHMTGAVNMPQKFRGRKK